MLLYLIRHAHAVDATGDGDAARRLSDRGRQQVRAFAKFLAKNEAFQPEEIWHSPLARAGETAGLLVQHLKLAVPRVVTPDLLPEADPRVVGRKLQAGRRSLALVGHEPHLSALASLLVAGAPAPPVFIMKKCAGLTLEASEGYWCVRWHVSPELLA